MLTKTNMDLNINVKHLTKEDIDAVPESTWYEYTLSCGHTVLTKVRIKIPENKSYMEHFIKCPIGKHQPLNWMPLS